VSRPARPRAAALLGVLAALAGCVRPASGLVRGIRTEDPLVVDRVEVKGPARAWRRLAVLPFDGAAAHRRPAEELAAVTLRAELRRDVLGPFAAARAAAEETASRAPAAPLDPAMARALAARLGVDALVLGTVEPGGAVARLVLVDAATGEPCASIRRAGAWRAALRGRHELAMASTRRALEDLVAVLRTPAGTIPSVPLRPPPLDDSDPGMPR
jgi:hypothetical protein